MKHIKTLGLLAFAVMAMAAIFGTASASAATFTASSAGIPLNISSSNHVFTVTGSNVTCNTITLTGETEGTDTETQSVHPSYSGCSAFGFGASVTPTNCKYTFNSDGTVHVVKTNTSEGAEPCTIHIEVNNAFAKCSVTITEQTIPGGVTFTDGSNTIGVTINGAANIADHVTESTGFCPLKVGTHNNAHYSGSSSVTPASGTIDYDA